MEFAARRAEGFSLPLSYGNKKIFFSFPSFGEECDAGWLSSSLIDSVDLEGSVALCSPSFVQPVATRSRTTMNIMNV